MERGWWCRTPLGGDKGTFDTDEALHALSVLFGISNQAVRATLLEIGNIKTIGKVHQLDTNGVDSFKSHNL